MSADAILLSWLSAFAPPARAPIVEWAESNIVLPAASNAEPGPLVYKPYQRGLVEAFADPEAETLVYMLASQTGKSTTIDSALLYSMACDPGPTLVVHPSEGKALDFVKNRLDPLIEATPAIRAIVGKGGRTSGGSSVRHKIFEGGSLSIGSSYNPDDLAARAIRYLLLDEIDRYATSAGQEGDPVTLAIKRTRTFSNRKIIIASTPTGKTTSRIAQWFLRGTQERYFVPCPECGALDYYRFDQLKWAPGKPQTAHIVCDDCGHHVTERERRAAIELGSWIPTAETTERIRSFHASELVSSFSTMESVAAQSEEADKSPEKKKAFVNTVLAETHDFGEEVSLDASELQLRAEPILRPLPKDILFIVAGVDVQAERLEASIIGIGAEMRAWVLRHERLLGDSAGSEPWKVLDVILGETFKAQDGRLLPISSCAIDSGYNTTHVAQFVAAQRRKQRNVIAVKGVSGWDKPIIRKGALLRGLTQLYLVGVDGVKAMIQRRLAMQEDGPGFIHLSDTLEPAYFEGLTVEKLQTKFVRGYAKMEFHNTARGGNEPLDCLTYALAVATVTRPSVATRNANTKQESIAERAARLQNLVNNAPASRH